MNSLDNINFRDAFYRAMSFETSGKFDANNPACINGTERLLCGTSGGSDDHGGNTKFGITKNSHPNVDIDHLTMQQAADIYYKEYWLPLHCDEMDRDLARIVFNISCGSGTKRAMMLLQSALGITADGVFGNQTREALKNKPNNLCGKLIGLQMDYYERIIALNPTQSKFINGWDRRALKFNDK